MMAEKSLLKKKVLFTILWLAIFAEIIFLYKDIFAWIKMAWFKYPPDMFGPYVIVFFLCIFLYRLNKKSKPAIESNFHGLSIVLIGTLVFLIGYVADIHIIQAASFILTCFGIVICMMGADWGRSMLFPFFFLLLMLPTISFLLESTCGVLIRYLITVVSGTILDLAGGEWRIAGGVLYLNEIELPVSYLRNSVSSPLVILILTFIVAEIVFTKNLYKFMFVLLFWLPLVVIGHSAFFISMGWSYEHDHIGLSRAIWSGREWLPAVFLITMLLLTGVAVNFFRRAQDY